MVVVDKLILHGLVVTMDGRDTLLEDGAVAVAGPRIAEVGASPELLARHGRPGVETIDATGHLVLPGLINLHTHAADSLFRGLIDDLPLEPWLERLWVIEKRFVRPDTVRLGSRLGYAEMIRGGITTALDQFFHPEVLAPAAVEMGFRVATGPVYFDSAEVDGVKPDERTPRGRELLQEIRGQPLVVPCVLPHSTYTVSKKSLEEARGLAREFGALLGTHLSETAAEVDRVRDAQGLTPPRYLERLGWFEGPTLFAHGVHLDPGELELLASRRAAVAHCPMSNLKLGSGVAPVPAMRRAGVRVGLGTDGPVSSNDLDLWSAMRLAAVLHKGVHRDPSLVPARDVVRMATIDAADILGLGDRLGSLEAGKEADIILVDTRRPHLSPLHDVYSLLVYAVGRGDVTTALIRGRVILRDRKLETVNEDELLDQMQSLGREIRQSMGSPASQSGN